MYLNSKVILNLKKFYSRLGELLAAMHLLEILVTSITGIQRQINGRMEESLLLLQIRNYLKIQTVL